MNLNFYFLLIFFFVSQSFCDETAQWRDRCKKLANYVQNFLTELDKLSVRDGPAGEIIEKLNNLKHSSMQLAKCFGKNQHILLESLITEHAQKIGQFCHNLLIGDALEGEVIRERLRHGIDQQKTRAVQVRQLIDTILIDWEIWPILYNFELGAESAHIAVDSLTDELGQKIGKMLQLLANCGSYYNTTALDEAMRKLMIVSINESDGPIKKLGQLWSIVPKLMAKSTLEVLDNLTMDLLEPTSPFYGIKFMTKFTNELNAAENICVGILRRSTLKPMEQYMVIEQFQKQRAKANGMFQEQYETIKDQIEGISKKLNNGLDMFKIEKGSMKREQLIESLSKIQNLFAIILNDLEMIELSAEINKMAKQKLDKLTQIIGQQKQMQNTEKNGEDTEITEELLDCLNVENIEKGIGKELEQMASKILF